MNGPGGRFGITAGAIAALIEVVLRLRDPGGAQRFVPLGKPHCRCSRRPRAGSRRLTAAAR